VIILWAYFPTIAEENLLNHPYIERTQMKHKLANKVRNLDFEAYVRGYNANTEEEQEYNIRTGIDMQFVPIINKSSIIVSVNTKMGLCFFQVYSRFELLA